MARVSGSRKASKQALNSLDEPQDNWWTDKSVTQRNLYMLENCLDTDVTFVFSNSTKETAIAAEVIPTTSGKHDQHRSFQTTRKMF